MSHKPQSYKVDDENKVIVLFDNILPSRLEEIMIERYLDKGYEHRFETKKKVTVEEMRADFGDDEKALEEFDRLYHLKPNEITEVGKNGKKKTGFHLAAKYHMDYVKAKKAAEKEKEEKKKK